MPAPLAAPPPTDAPVRAGAPSDAAPAEPDARAVVRRLRQLLYVLAAGLFAGTPAELALMGHTEGWTQAVPLVLCGVALASVGAAWIWPRRGTLLALRGTMGAVVFGSLFGIYEHVTHNFAFEMEIRPGATATDVLWDALGGASPLMAPGVLALAAVLAVAATYAHPAWRR
jgi:hypothetical protein